MRVPWLGASEPTDPEQSKGPLRVGMGTPKADSVNIHRLSRSSLELQTSQFISLDILHIVTGNEDISYFRSAAHHDIIHDSVAFES